jgi:hypothetical protein
LLTTLVPFLVERLEMAWWFRFAHFFYLGSDFLGILANGLLIFGLAAVLADARRRVWQSDGPRRPLMEVQPGDQAGSAEEPPGRQRRLGGENIQP